MRVVIDTVVVVRSLIDPFSWSGKLLHDRANQFEWIVSPEIVFEYLEVIKRPKLMRKYLAAENRDLNAMLVRIAVSTVVEPSYAPAVCRDPSDDKFLAAALACGASFIVSEDNDLLALNEYEGIEVCTAEALLKFLDSSAT